MLCEWIPKIRNKEVWYKNPNKDNHLVIRKVTEKYFEGEYYHTQSSTWKWVGETHDEVLGKAVKDIEIKED